MQVPKVIISGGGTGGHIYPAIAIADALKKEMKAEVLFVGAKGKMEMQKVPAAGYPIKGLWISGIERKLSLKNLIFPLKLVTSVIKASRMVGKFKPDVAIGVGGYASGPTLYAASKKGIPTVIQEQNSYPGITNKWLSKKASIICVAYDGMERFFPKGKLVLTGNPVRKEIENLSGKKQRAREHFALEQGNKVVLVIGGSQGARTINESIKAGLKQLKTLGVSLIWQTGKSYIEEAKAAIKNEGYAEATAFAFIERMDLAYAVADLVVSRAGALSVSELCVAGKASILIPFPYAAEDHQTKNAQALVLHKAAELIKDSEANEKLMAQVSALIQNHDKLEMMEKKMKQLALTNAAEAIVFEIKNLLNRQ